MTNRERAESREFIELCDKAGVKPTPRQASKLKNKKGRLWLYLKYEKKEVRRDEANDEMWK